MKGEVESLSFGSVIVIVVWGMFLPVVGSKQRSVTFGSGSQDPLSMHVMTTLLLDPIQLIVAVVPTKAGLL